MGPSCRITHVIGYIGYQCDYIELLGTGFMQVLYSGRAPRTKETLPDFLKWRRVTRHPLVFRGLTGSQRIPGFGASHITLLLTKHISKVRVLIYVIQNEYQSHNPAFF